MSPTLFSIIIHFCNTGGRETSKAKRELNNLFLNRQLIGSSVYVGLCFFLKF